MAEIPETKDAELPEPSSRRGSWRRSKKLTVGLAIAGLFVLGALFADFLAPYDYREQVLRAPLAPAVTFRFRDPDGQLRIWPLVYAQRMTDPLTRTYEEDREHGVRVGLFVRGYRYKLFGLIPCDRHLFGTGRSVVRSVPRVTTEGPGALDHDRETFGVTRTGPEGPARVSLLGTDELGRDRFSRLIIAARFSLLVGPMGALLATLLGIILGAWASHGRRLLDGLLMRAADAMMALPALVLILAARAAFPLELPPWRAAMLMIGIFLAVGWAEVARLSRGLIIAEQRREYILAARALGLSTPRIFVRHILPNIGRPLIVQFTIMLPAFVLAETALSFLGVGLQEPEPSWGNMLAGASDLTKLQAQPLVLLAPAFAILILVVGVRLISDGLKK
jgi:peptide/nickel transport system permease protein